MEGTPWRFDRIRLKNMTTGLLCDSRRSKETTVGKTHKGEQTRHRMIEAAVELFEEVGYHAAGISAILGRAKAPRGSFYFHFPGGKEELGVAAIVEGSRVVAELVEDARGGSGLETIRGVLDGLATRLEESDFRKGCPITTVALEVAHESDALQRACQSVYDGWRDAITELLEHEGFVGEDAAERLKQHLSAEHDRGACAAAARIITRNRNAKGATGTFVLGGKH